MNILSSISVSDLDVDHDELSPSKTAKKVQLLHPKIAVFVIPVLCMGLYFYRLVNDPMRLS